MLRARIIGRGRAGTSLAIALRRVGWSVDGPLSHEDSTLPSAAQGADLVVLAVPDPAVSVVAHVIAPNEACVVAHLAGALGLEVLGHHRRRASLHPLVALPGGELGADRLMRSAWFAVSGDPLVGEVVAALGGKTVSVADEDRNRYHAAAVMASNHLVTLLAEVEQVAASCGVPLDAYLDLVRGTVENVAELGPRAALTGPVLRGDHATIDRHLSELTGGAADVYRVLTAAAERLVAR